VNCQSLFRLATNQFSFFHCSLSCLDPRFTFCFFSSLPFSLFLSISPAQWTFIAALPRSVHNIPEDVELSLECSPAVSTSDRDRLLRHLITADIIKAASSYEVSGLFLS
jgi:hypothetical protein